MKYVYTVGVLLAFLVVPQLTAAETVVRTGETVSVGADQSVTGTFYGVGGTVVTSGLVEGDVVLAGGTVTLNGEVTNDVLVIGGTVGVYGPVGDDVRILGGDVTIADAVEGSVAVVGGVVRILSSATISGDVLVYGGSVTIEGEVTGQVLGNAEQIRIDGLVGGVDVTTASLTLGERAVVANDVRYVSINDITRAAGATVEGAISRSDIPSAPSQGVDSRTILIPFLVSLFASLSLYLLFRQSLERFVGGISRRYGLAALLGAGTFILAPIVGIIMIASVLGLLVGLMGLFVFLLALVTALSLMSVVMGGLLSAWFTKKSQINVLWITLGAISIQVALLIPVVGPALFLGLFVITLGGVVYGIHRLLR